LLTGARRDYLDSIRSTGEIRQGLSAGSVGVGIQLATARQTVGVGPLILLDHGQ
jgi:hypothetical protein